MYSLQRKSILQEEFQIRFWSVHIRQKYIMIDGDDNGDEKDDDDGDGDYDDNDNDDILIGLYNIHIFIYL